MSNADALYDAAYCEALEQAKSFDLSDGAATTAMQNLKTLSECRPPATPEPEAIPEPPSTVLGKLKAGVAGVWDNETTRVLIKSGGAFAGVALIAWTTIHRDHVIQRDAMSMANQRPS